MLPARCLPIMRRFFFRLRVLRRFWFGGQLKVYAAKVFVVFLLAENTVYEIHEIVSAGAGNRPSGQVFVF